MNHAKDRTVMLPGTLRDLLVLSPHCDDAVFACGRLLESHPGAVVATIFAGSPGVGNPRTEWDCAAGFGPQDDVMAVRRAEDRAALRLLGARPLWLGFLDDQYRPRHRLEEVRQAVACLVRDLQPSAVFLPLGLFHADHRAVHEAARQSSAMYPKPGWFVYEDALYRRIPGLVEERLREVDRAGWFLSPTSFPTCHRSERKMQAVRCYQSQLRALGTKGRPGYVDALSPERYWRLLRKEGATTP
ncbi:MAG TPA: PIG-L family deacetylase [Nitrospira sp.]|nr:PIG-L family deacetylase [Nitrospira sp.]